MRLAHHMISWNSWYRKEKLPFDLDRMLAEIKAAGYNGVELGGNEETLGTPAQLQRKLADHGLEIAAFGSSVTANPYPPNTEQYKRDFEYAAELGVEIITICGGFVPEQRRTMFDSDYALFAENLANAFDYTKKLGLTLTFHPHCGCLVETIAETQKLWEYLPDLPLCIDTGHLIAVRSNPIELIKLKPELVRHFHLKDWSREKRRFVELGQGDAGLDFTHLFQTLREIEYKGWLAVELDEPQGSALEAAQVSFEFLNGKM